MPCRGMREVRQAPSCRSEEADVERLRVTEGGRLVGVLSRSGLQRRLAEDEPPEPERELS